MEEITGFDVSMIYVSTTKNIYGWKIYKEKTTIKKFIG